MKNDSPYILLVLLFCGLGYLYLHLRTKSGFKYLKSEYGRNDGGIYGHSSVRQLVRELSAKTQNGLSVSDSTIIKIDESEFPLVYGSVLYANYQHTRTSTRSAYFLITDQANKHLIDNHPDLFEFSEKSGEYSVYWAINIKGLVAFQSRTASKKTEKMCGEKQEAATSSSSPFSMSETPPITEIRLILGNYPGLHVEETSDSIVVLPDDINGFPVRLKVERDNYIISYGSWHEYLPKSEIGQKAAVGLFKFGLSDSCKLLVHQKGGMEHKCILSHRNQQTGQWEVVAKQALFIHPFWKVENVRYLQNNVIEGDEIFELFNPDEFEKVITEIACERKYAKYALVYASIWIGAFLKLNNFDAGNIGASFLLFFPVIVLTLLLPIVMMRNWFNDRKLGKHKKLILNKRQRKFIFIWIAIWFLSFMAISMLWGAENLLPLLIIGFPFILVCFSIPIYIMMEKK